MCFLVGHIIIKNKIKMSFKHNLCELRNS